MATTMAATSARSACTKLCASTWKKSLGVGFGLRAFSSDAAESKVYGGLSDEDRIFTNLYGKHDAFLKVRKESQTKQRSQKGKKKSGKERCSFSLSLLSLSLLSLSLSLSLSPFFLFQWATWFYFLTLFLVFFFAGLTVWKTTT